MFESFMLKCSRLFRRWALKTEKVKIIGVYVPRDFPSKTCEKVLSGVAKQISDDPEENLKFDEFAYAWESVAYKFTTLTYDHYEFSESVKNFGLAPQKIREKEIQDNALFSFFVNSQSVIESLCYALYFLGSIRHPTEFPTNPENLAGIHPKMVRNLFIKNFSQENVTAELNTLIGSTQFFELTVVRNAVVHRSIPDRQRRLIKMQFKGFSNAFIIPIDSWIIGWKTKDKVRSTKDKPIFKEGTISVLNLTEYRDWLLRSLVKVMSSTNQLASKEIDTVE
jgi:hypothetical protein